MPGIYETRLDQFLARLPKKSPVRTIDTVTTAFQIVENVKEKVAGILADGRLTHEGKTERIRDMLGKGPTEHMRQLRTATDRDLEAIKGERAGMRRRVVSPEVSKFPDAMKAEVRTWMRGLTDKERLALVSTTKDPLITEAIATAPHYLSGVQEAHWNGLIDRTIEAQNYARLPVLAVEEEAFEAADAAIKVATADLKREAGLGEAEFETLAV